MVRTHVRAILPLRRRRRSSLARHTPLAGGDDGRHGVLPALVLPWPRPGAPLHARPSGLVPEQGAFARPDGCGCERADGRTARQCRSAVHMTVLCDVARRPRRSPSTTTISSSTCCSCECRRCCPTGSSMWPRPSSTSRLHNSSLPRSLVRRARDTCARAHGPSRAMVNTAHSHGNAHDVWALIAGASGRVRARRERTLASCSSRLP
jgi:hypothetical protein